MTMQQQKSLGRVSFSGNQAVSSNEFTVRRGSKKISLYAVATQPGNVEYLIRPLSDPSLGPFALGAAQAVVANQLDDFEVLTNIYGVFRLQIRFTNTNNTPGTAYFWGTDDAEDA